MSCKCLLHPLQADIVRRDRDSYDRRCWITIAIVFDVLFIRTIKTKTAEWVHMFVTDAVLVFNDVSASWTFDEKNTYILDHADY